MPNPNKDGSWGGFTICPVCGEALIYVTTAQEYQPDENHHAIKKRPYKTVSIWRCGSCNGIYRFSH